MSNAVATAAVDGDDDGDDDAAAAAAAAVVGDGVAGVEPIADATVLDAAAAVVVAAAAPPRPRSARGRTPSPHLSSPTNGEWRSS